MTSGDNPLRLTPITCRWLPCREVLGPDKRAEFCKSSHRVRAAQEAARLRDLLAALQQPGELVDLVLAGVPQREREGHLRRLQVKLRRRIAILRPDDAA